MTAARFALAALGGIAGGLLAGPAGALAGATGAFAGAHLAQSQKKPPPGPTESQSWNEWIYGSDTPSYAQDPNYFAWKEGGAPNPLGGSPDDPAGYP